MRETLLVVNDDAIRLAVIDKLGWIRRKRAAFETHPRQSAREMVSGESHYFLGQRYRLRVVAGTGAGRFVLRQQTMELHVRPDSDMAYRQQVLAKWEPVVGVQANGWRVKKMKTKWGSCSPAAGRIWRNSELTKTPLPCIEYIIVHELAHLLERLHGALVALLDRVMPQWQQNRAELNQMPLGHEEW